MFLSLLIPVYKEEKAIKPFYDVVLPIIASITEDYEIIFSMDPSSDGTELEILRIRENNPKIKLIKYSRRFGQAMAILGAMRFSVGEAVVVIDVDLQDPPELIKQMVEKYKEGFDVVYAQRVSREGETITRKIIAWVGYWVISKLADVEIPRNTGEFRLMSRRAVSEVLQLKEANGFLRGLVALVGFRQTSVQFERKTRVTGQTKYSPTYGSIKIGMNGIICFSNNLLSWSTITGFCTAGFSFLLGILYSAFKFSGYYFPIGNPTIVILVLFIGGVQLISVGILGEYIGRIYDEVKQRPKFIVDTKFGFE